jgi:hypothetical protein
VKSSSRWRLVRPFSLTDGGFGRLLRTGRRRTVPIIVTALLLAIFLWMSAIFRLCSSLASHSMLISYRATSQTSHWPEIYSYDELSPGSSCKSPACKTRVHCRSTWSGMCAGVGEGCKENRDNDTGRSTKRDCRVGEVEAVTQQKQFPHRNYVSTLLSRRSAWLILLRGLSIVRCGSRAVVIGREDGWSRHAT